MSGQGESESESEGGRVRVVGDKVEVMQWRIAMVFVVAISLS